MGVFTFPAIFVVVIICALATHATMTAIKETENRDHPNEDEISPNIARHPFLLNPIILIYIIVGLFMTIVIFYYWSKSNFGS